MQSCELMLKSVTCLLKTLEFMSPDATNAIMLQSQLTLVAGNLHTTTKMKHPAPSVQDYCRDFGKTMRESIKWISNTSPIGNPILIPSRTRSWSFCYWKIKSDSNSAHEQDEPCKDGGTGQYSKHGQCVRQLTVRQQTTQFSAGTLPMSAYGL